MRDTLPHSLAGHTIVYGGSFNPPHMGHQMACLYLLEALGAAEIWLVPTYRHPFGKELAPFEDRVRMCDLLAEVFAPRVKVSCAEQTLGGSGRTYDLLLHLGQSCPGRVLTLAVGADILCETHQWHRWEDLVAMWRVVAIGREGYPCPDDAALILPNVSSSAVRSRCRTGESLTGLVPAAVAAYVETRRLYRQ